MFTQRQSKSQRVLSHNASCVPVLDRFLLNRSGSLDQSSQTRRDPLQVSLHNAIPLDQSPRTKYVYREMQRIPKPQPASSQKTDFCFSGFSSHYPQQYLSGINWSTRSHGSQSLRSGPLSDLAIRLDEATNSVASRHTTSRSW